MPNENMTFETAMERLETIVHTLEEGNTPLDESLSVFEEGIRLVKFCNKKLENAEQRVKILLSGENGEKIAEDFTVNG